MTKSAHTQLKFSKQSFWDILNQQIHVPTRRLILHVCASHVHEFANWRLEQLHD